MKPRKNPGLQLVLSKLTSIVNSDVSRIRTKITCSCEKTFLVIIPECVLQPKSEVLIEVEDDIKDITPLIVKQFKLAIECPGCSKEIDINLDKFVFLRQSRNAFSN